MLKEFEGRGKTLEEARNAALIGLNAPASADVHVEVVQMPKKKVLGLFGGSDAVAGKEAPAPPRSTGAAQKAGAAQRQAPKGREAERAPCCQGRQASCT